MPTKSVFEATRALLETLKAMQEDGEDRRREFFGPFYVYEEARDRTGDYGVTVEWPNLAICINELERALKEANVVLREGG